MIMEEAMGFNVARLEAATAMIIEVLLKTGGRTRQEHRDAALRGHRRRIRSECRGIVQGILTPATLIQSRWLRRPRGTLLN